MLIPTFMNNSLKLGKNPNVHQLLNAGINCAIIIQRNTANDKKKPTADIFKTSC